MSFDVRPFVNPDLLSMLDAIEQFTQGVLSADSLAQQRAGASMFLPKPLDTPQWREHVIPGLPGQPDVRVYIVNEGKRDKPRPAILHLHGGGFIMGGAYLAINPVQQLASELDCVFLTVDYRLAPETRFPGALNDNYAALAWLVANAEELGADPARIALMGDSAGGGHAAMLAIAARDRGELHVACQILIYPMLDDRTGSTVQRPPQQGALMWTPARNRFGWESLLGVPAGAAEVPYGSVPARVENLQGLPPTFIGVGSIDLFVGEDIEFAHRLIDAGVACELIVVPGAFHGFDFASESPLVRKFKAALLGAIRAWLAIGVKQ